MRVLITGSSGLIGSALCGRLESGGHEVVPLLRGKGNGPYWDPAKEEIDLSGVGKIDAVVHLAGDNIASGRWTESKKQCIRESRVEATALLCEALGGLPSIPSVLISGSAVGFYGDRGEETLTEESAPGKGYLPEVVADWEAATESAEEVGIRVVHIRTGVVLSPDGGALAKMLLPFKLCLGGVLGGGDQQMSWIDIRDEVSAICFLIENSQISGPVNLTAPAPVTNYQFTKTLGKVLGRPTILPLPAFMVRLLFGEMGEHLLLEGARIKPAVLLKHGFQFQYSEVESSLASLLK